MKLRMTLMLIAVAAVVGVLGAVKVKQVQTTMAQYANFQPPPESVTTTTAREDQWPRSFSAIGTVAAVRGVDVSADLPGTVVALHFESGTHVSEGDVLAELDTRQERAQLAAAEAQLHLAQANLGRMQGLRGEGIVAQSEFDQAEATQRQAEASVGEIRATIARKTIRAPFSGALGIRQANLGQYLAGGAPIVPLQSLNPIYVNFSVPQDRGVRLKPGTPVTVTVQDSDVQLTGHIAAIDAVVDPATRNVQVQARFVNEHEALRPGMFVQAHVSEGGGERLVSLPASSVNYAPYGDSVFVVTMLKNPKGDSYRGVQQRFIKLGGARGDQVSVLSGVAPGEEVVTSGVFKLKNGAAVQINNSVQPSNKPAPRPEDS